MTLRDALAAQARAVTVRPDLLDVHRRADAKRRVTRRNAGSRRVFGAVAVVALLATIGGVVAAVVRRDEQVRQATVPDPAAVAALVFDEAVPPAERLGRALERVDPTALDGPWSVLVRTPNGALGRDGAVVTYPVDDVPLETRVIVNGRDAGAGEGIVVWPVGDAYARVRGELPRADLVRIANATTVVDGRPAVDAPDGLRVVATVPYRAPTVREARYGSIELGEAGPLGNGLAYTSVFTAGSFEDQLYARATRTRVDVDDRQAIVSDVGGGNATLAWEIAPGTVAFVGYSGTSLSATSRSALVRIAGRATPLDLASWQARQAQVVEQENDFG